ncbi:MAG: hypothetical protein WA160_16220 [Pseudobdellovibrio sp.]
MNAKATIIALALIASLHGQAAEGINVIISQARLQNLNAEHINFLAQNKIIKFENNQAVLNMNKLDVLLKSYEKTGDLKESDMIRARVVPYGCT